MPRVLVVSFSDLARDPRVNRQIRFLAERYRVLAAGWADPEVPGVGFVELARVASGWAARARGAARLALRRHDAYYWNRADVRDAIARLSSAGFDAIVANDLDTLPLALRLAGSRPVVFDAHEYAPSEFEELLHFRLLHRPCRQHLCRTYIPQASEMITVSEGIAEQYERDTGVRPTVIQNAPDYEPLAPSRPPGDPRVLRLVHHGGAQRARRIESMIRMMRHLDERFELNLMLMENEPAYLRALRAEAAGDQRIRFLVPVPMRELPRFLNRFDVGVYILPPTDVNKRLALPNKFFEFVQARLAVGIGPSPEMARLVQRHGLGVTARDFTPEALAEVLTRLDREGVQAFKAKAHAAARELSADSSRTKLQALAARALGAAAEHAAARR